jgi:hypothetical protein
MAFTGAQTKLVLSLSFAFVLIAYFAAFTMLAPSIDIYELSVSGTLNGLPCSYDVWAYTSNGWEIVYQVDSCGVGEISESTF